MFMNKRLTLTPAANFASRHFQLHSSLGCVQPCTVYPCFFCQESIVDKPHQPQGPKLMPRCRDFWVSSTGEHRFESYTISFSWLFLTPSLRRWKSAALGRCCGMWINGSDIKFMHRTLPEMRYMFHALYTHAPDRTPGHVTTWNSVFAPEALICTTFADFWGAMMKRVPETGFCGVLQAYPQNTRC